jgi:uncharacterized membrane protein
MIERYKALIAPIIAVIAIALQLIFGIELKQEIQSDIVTAIVNIIVVGVTVYGIINNNVKDKEKDPTE